MTARINGVPVEDGVSATVDEIDYHRDTGSLSQSGAKILIGKGGPEKFRDYIDSPRKTTRTFDFGHMAHRLVLGKGAELAVLDPAVHGLKKDGSVADSPAATTTWKAAAAEARERGEVPVHIDEHRIAETMAAKVKAHPIAGPLFRDGHAEVSLYHTDEETGVRMRARADWITIADLGDGHGERPVIVDYKTTVAGGADKDMFCRKAFDYGYYLQFVWYVRLYAAAMKCDLPAFLFVAQEKVSPFMVNVIELDLDAFRLGNDHMREALRIYRDCCNANLWPGYEPIIHRGSLPPWAFSSAAPTIHDLVTAE